MLRSHFSDGDALSNSGSGSSRISQISTARARTAGRQRAKMKAHGLLHSALDRVRLLEDQIAALRYQLASFRSTSAPVDDSDIQNEGRLKFHGADAFVCILVPSDISNRCQASVSALWPHYSACAHLQHDVHHAGAASAMLSDADGFTGMHDVVMRGNCARHLQLYSVPDHLFNVLSLEQLRTASRHACRSHFSDEHDSTLPPPPAPP